MALHHSILALCLATACRQHCATRPATVSAQVRAQQSLGGSSERHRQPGGALNLGIASSSTLLRAEKGSRGGGELAGASRALASRSELFRAECVPEGSAGKSVLSRSDAVCVLHTQEWLAA